MQKQVGRVDHVTFIYKKENLDSAIKQLGDALGITDWEGPVEFKRFGILQAQSLEAGVELLAPTGETGFIADYLREHGEGFFALILGVDDLDKAVTAARDKGIEPVLDENGEPLVIDSLAIGANGKPGGHASWPSKLKTYKEVPFENVAGINLYLGEIEPL